MTTPKLLIACLCIIAFQSLPAQQQKRVVRTRTTSSKDKSLYDENDRHGNTLFSINNGMNGPITMIFASDYDSLSRETKEYSVHSNFGFSLGENVYEKSCIRHYAYEEAPESSVSYDRESLKKIRTKKDFTGLEAFRILEKNKRHLSRIEFLDSANRVVKEVYFSDTGDTSSIHNYKYNSKNQEVFFHYGTPGDEFWTWDIYYEYDQNGNRVKSFRISSSEGAKDTSEIYNYAYNAQNMRVSDSYYHKKAFKNRTDYFYNKNNQLVTKLFYEGDEAVLDVKTTFEYAKEGYVKKKTQTDYRSDNNGITEVFVTKLQYW